MQNNFKYGLIGYNGRLGKEVQFLFNEKGHHLVFKIDKENVWQYEKPDVLIDCSLPSAVEKNLSYAESFNVPFIIAVTGLTSEYFLRLQKLAKKFPIVQSYNFSPGIQLLLSLTEMVNEKLGDWDVEIVETHHRHKKDKPSGTAKMIKEIFKRKDINISSLRIGEAVGEHTVNFGGEGDILSITHRATSRRTFAAGILKSVLFVLRKQNGLYSFTDVDSGR